ncbi:hypothetical protein LTR62_001779 [Meristemomyces frigidus]|uniref:Uncharacterized protein n=1 Tax=Meristemomyces frigidus TaxID=1508187 RepID=A0AAN7TS75_9PEZI|nr:hypothetical protein LTR62_001779 [Meristemomyces frigidus]
MNVPRTVPLTKRLATGLKAALQKEGKPEEKKLATAEQHNAAPGPVINQSIGEPEGTKEERRKKAEEMNK